MNTTKKLPPEIKALPDLLDYVDRAYAGEDRVLFRGQTDANWGLSPRIARMKLRFNFQQKPLEAEAALIRDFSRLAHAYPETERQKTIWDTLALAQHHGMPTRLLDWTSNPLVALWFAVKTAPSEKNTHAAVWVLRTEEDDQLDETISLADLKRTSVFRPNHTNGRLVAQSGWFTAHIFDKTKNRFSDIQRVTIFRERLVKLLVPVTAFPAIREAVARCGVSEASMFPDLGGLCRHIAWKYELLDDEAEHDIWVSL
jgi:hypothetical protein